MRPPQEHIDAAILIESQVRPEDLEFYMECMNGLPMSQRQTDQELRDGCILTHHIYAQSMTEDQVDG